MIFVCIVKYFQIDLQFDNIHPENKARRKMDKQKESPKTAKKRAKEMETLKIMIAIYCDGNHQGKKGWHLLSGHPEIRKLCPKCQELATFALSRTAACPHMATKTFCSACKTPCYPNDRRDQIRKVMRYSGPRMIFHMPLKALKHALLSAWQLLGRSK